MMDQTPLDKASAAALNVLGLALAADALMGEVDYPTSHPAAAQAHDGLYALLRVLCEKARSLADALEAMQAAEGKDARDDMLAAFDGLAPAERKALANIARGMPRASCNPATAP